MLQAKTTVIPTETSDVKDVESATSILARIWPEYDPHGYGIMAEMMETVLRRVEKEQGASLLSQSSWEELGDYIVRVEGTIVSQRDLSELLSLLQGAPPPTTVPSVEIPIVGEEFHQLTSVSGLDIPQNYTNIGQSVEIRDGAHQRYGMMSPFSESVSAQSTQQSLHPRHHPSVHIRPRGNRPPIRKISLGESTQSRPRFSRSSRGSSSGDEDSDRSEHRMSPSSPGSRGSRSDASTSSSSPTIGDSKEWRANYNNMSIREQSRTEYEGYGLDAEYDSPANIESDQQKFLALQRKLKETERELEYQSRANEQAMAASMNQQEIEELRRDVIAKRREIEEFKKNDQYKSAQIAELTQQIEKSELSSSTQKSNAVAWKKRQDELMEDNARIRESLKQTEDALKPLITRLATAEALERRYNAEQRTNEELRERLAQEIAMNEEIRQKLELATRETLRLTELNGDLKNEVETLAGGANTSSLSFSQIPEASTKNLMSELATADPKFAPGIENSDDEIDVGSKHHFNSVSSEKALRLLQESSSLNRKLKRTSLRDIDQRFKESGLQSALKYEVTDQHDTQNLTDITAASRGQTEPKEQGTEQELSSVATNSVVGKHRVDDVDCVLPPEVQILEAKEAMLNQGLESQQELIETLFKIQEATRPLDTTSFGADGVIRQNEPLAKLQKSERARRRRLHQSRLVSSAPGTLPGSVLTGASTSTAVSKKESNRVITNVTLVSLYTIVGYILGLITSVFLVDNGGYHPALNYGRLLSYEAMQNEAANVMEGGPGRFKVIEILAYWIQNLVWQADAGYVPT